MGESGNPLPERKKRGALSGNKRAIGNPGGGRKPKFKPAFIGVARKACERGFTDQEVADLLGINASTLYRWRVEYPHFARAVRLGKEIADARVERSLYERAVGYSFEAQKAVMTRRGQEILRWREHLPPDTGAAMAYLRNRRPDLWRNTIKHEHTQYRKRGGTTRRAARASSQARFNRSSRPRNANPENRARTLRLRFVTAKPAAKALNSCPLWSCWLLLLLRAQWLHGAGKHVA
jgi:transposase-like protein